MAAAAYATGFFCSATDSSYVEIDGVKDVAVDPSMMELDTTNFKDTTQGRLRIAGLLDCDVSCSGDWLTADAPQMLIATSLFGRTSIWLKILPDGIFGWKGSFLCTGLKIDPKVDGLVPFSASFKLDAGVLTVI